MAECKICGVTDKERVQQGRSKLGIDKLCDGCWESTSRLDSFLMLPKGRAYVEEKLAEIRKREEGNGLDHNTDDEQRPPAPAPGGTGPGRQDTGCDTPDPSLGPGGPAYPDW